MRAVGSVLACVVLLCACASSGSGGGGRTRRDGGSGRDGGGVDGGVPTSCDGDGDCAPSQFCSATGRCIPGGTCLVDGDCPGGGRRCGPTSHLCLGPGNCVALGDCPDGMECDLATMMCRIGEGCGGDEFMLTRVAPNMMILLDRSGSMEGSIGGSTRWDVAKDAIDTVTTMFGADIRFGLATYSSCLSGGCSAGSIVVPIADMNAGAINGFLGPLRGSGSSRGTPPDYLCDSGDPETSTGKSLDALVGEATLQDPMRDNTVLLITDGNESGDCIDGGIDDEQGAHNLLAQMRPVRTFAVGFTSDVDIAALDRVAMAGGTMESYAADDPASLLMALEEIAGAVISCRFRLGTAPPDTTMLYVYFNDDPAGVPQSASDGWTYDPATMTLEFHGSACDRLQSGEVVDVDVVYGCEGPVLE